MSFGLVMFNEDSAVKNVRIVRKLDTFQNNFLSTLQRNIWE